MTDIETTVYIALNALVELPDNITRTEMTRGMFGGDTKETRLVIEAHGPTLDQAQTALHNMRLSLAQAILGDQYGIHSNE